MPATLGGRGPGDRLMGQHHLALLQAQVGQVPVVAVGRRLSEKGLPEEVINVPLDDVPASEGSRPADAQNRAQAGVGGALVEKRVEVAQVQ